MAEPQPATFDERLADAMRRGYVAAWRWLGDRDAAHDAVQEAAARSWAARERYDADRPLYPWFYRILRNHCMDRLASRKREAPLDAGAERPVAPRAEASLIADERQRAVLAAIESLPDDLREIIELRHFQDLSYAEMAEVLGCPKGTVMSRLYRARQALRDQLQTRADP